MNPNPIFTHWLLSNSKQICPAINLLPSMDYNTITVANGTTDVDTNTIATLDHRNLGCNFVPVFCSLEHMKFLFYTA